MKEYIAKKAASPLLINDARWEKADYALLDCVWEGVPAPYETKAQLIHTDDGITVRLSSKEWPLEITAMNPNDSVCIDSCLEFFFIPNESDENYINVEMNAIGTSLVCIGAGRGSRDRLDFFNDLKVQTLIEPMCGWTVMLHIPYAFLLKHYSHCDKVIRGNFYKCGNNTVIPHYCTWNKVETPKPDYHRPEYFGKIILSDDEI